MAALPHLGVKIQVLAIFLLTLLLIIIDQYDRKKDYRRLVWLIPLFYLWSCLHASFLIGIVILFFWPAVKILEKILARYSRRCLLNFSYLASRREILIFTFFALAALAATMLTPYGLELYKFLAGYTDQIYGLYIQEWSSPVWPWPDYWQLLFLLAVIFIIPINFFRGQIEDTKNLRTELWPLLLSILFLFLSFKSRRHFPLLFVSSFYLIMSSAVAVLMSDLALKSLVKKNTIKISILIYVFVAMVGLGIATNKFSNPFEFFSLDYPYVAIQYLRVNPQYANTNIFNDYSWGGYLIWVYPEKQVFIDGRLPQIKYEQETFLQKYLNFLKPDRQTEDKFKEYGIGLVILPIQDRPQDKSLAALREYLAASPNWHRIYADLTTIIFQAK